ncbi:hypothetical protein [Comamonas sp. C24C]
MDASTMPACALVGPGFICSVVRTEAFQGNQLVRGGFMDGRSGNAIRFSSQ